MPWLQLHILADAATAPAVEDALLSCGAAAVTLQDNADQPILEPALGETPLWQATQVTGLYDATADTAAISEQVNTHLKKPLEHRWEQLEDKDWQREWMSHYQPIRCGERLWICPSWAPPPDPQAINVMLDPGLAFGTGTHPTTLLCLQWLAEQEIAGLEVIDYGCGSGILGIAALLLGARQVAAVDIDPQALLATRDNAQRNQLPDGAITTALPPQWQRQPADLVFANILAGPLVELAAPLTAATRPGGRLCLSGILAEQAASVQAAYADTFDFAPIRELDHWVQLAGTRRTP